MFITIIYPPGVQIKLIFALSRAVYEKSGFENFLPDQDRTSISALIARERQIRKLKKEHMFDSLYLGTFYSKDNIIG